MAVGGEVKLHPEVGLEVAALELGRSLVLRGGVPMGSAPPPYDSTWAFMLREQPDGTTRLLVRERYASTRRWAPGSIVGRVRVSAGFVATSSAGVPVLLASCSPR